MKSICGTKSGEMWIINHKPFTSDRKPQKGRELQPRWHWNTLQSFLNEFSFVRLGKPSSLCYAYALVYSTKAGITGVFMNDERIYTVQNGGPK